MSESIPPGERPAGQGLLRPVLWLVLIVTAAANTASLSMSLDPLVGIGFGLAALACVAALVVHHYRHRR